MKPSNIDWTRVKSGQIILIKFKDHGPLIELPPEREHYAGQIIPCIVAKGTSTLDPRSVYLCQNHRVGMNAPYLHKMKYSWLITNNSTSDLEVEIIHFFPDNIKELMQQFGLGRSIAEL